MQCHSCLQQACPASDVEIADYFGGLDAEGDSDKSDNGEGSANVDDYLGDDAVDSDTTSPSDSK